MTYTVICSVCTSSTIAVETSSKRASVAATSHIGAFDWHNVTILKS